MGLKRVMLLTFFQIIYFLFANSTNSLKKDDPLQNVANNHYCLTNSNCTWLPGSDCVNNNCKCMTGFERYENMCVFGKCNSHMDCDNIEGASCSQKNICVCPENKRLQYNERKCGPFAMYGGLCGHHADCWQPDSNLLQEAALECIGGECKCREGYSLDGEFCVSKGYITIVPSCAVIIGWIFMAAMSCL